MEIIILKELLEILLIKKNNYLLQKEEQKLINELCYLLSKDNESNKVQLECKCELDKITIKAEIAKNKCLDCGLPLTIL